MEYHQYRFIDFSVLIYKNDKLIALFPANVKNAIVFSHQGLTFGSLILPEIISATDVFLIFESVCGFYKAQEIKEIFIKQIPEVYFKKPSFELGFKLSQKAELIKSDMVLAIDYSKPLTIHKTKLKHYKKSKQIDLKVVEGNDFTNFWNKVLQPRLLGKHNVKPVHNLDEIILLNNRFPNNIRQFDVYLNDEILAGITIFNNNGVVKSQYGATTTKGEKVRALDFLFLHLIYEYQKQGKSFFSMGTVTENSEIGYNPGLLKQKEELGCQVYLQDFFKLKL